jgi:DNA mismatch repair protein MutH
MASFRDLGESCIVEIVPSSCINSALYLTTVSRIVYKTAPVDRHLDCVSVNRVSGSSRIEEEVRHVGEALVISTDQKLQKESERRAEEAKGENRAVELLGKPVEQLDSRHNHNSAPKCAADNIQLEILANQATKILLC